MSYYSLMIKRKISEKFQKLAKEFPVITVTGPRQSGKTTLTKMLFPNKTYVSLENPDQRKKALEDPRGFLRSLSQGAILDEIQRAPEIPSYLQQMVDDDPAPGRFILTGSQQLEVSQTISQSLAGRTAILRLLPLSLEEVRPVKNLTSSNEIMLMGFYPRVFNEPVAAKDFYAGYFSTYIERDLRQLTQIDNLPTFERFVQLLGGRVGQLFNASSLANDLGVSQPTVRKWLSLLEASYIVYQLPPFFRNVGKRLIKTPKIYFYDVGLAAYLMGIENVQMLRNHPLRGNLFENMLVMELLKSRHNQGERLNLFFYRDRTGNEIDLVAEKARSLLPIEIKAAETVNLDWFKSFKHFKSLFKEAEPGVVLYGGQEKSTLSGGSFMPWDDQHVAGLV
ncbi:ATP-binding protein [candidate division FCPU426 bacterium]|nr:ATP-binding protein [candidate division FCPU426 bacterium]